MKKEYIKPEMAVEEILVETMIATSPGGVEEGEPDQPLGTNDRRGGWGDLWD